MGLSYDFIAGNAPETWAAKLRPETRAIYVETMTNPLMEVADLEAVVAFAREHGLVSLIDNTFASPCNFRPLEIGFDIELHSATKYLQRPFGYRRGRGRRLGGTTSRPLSTS